MKIKGMTVVDMTNRILRETLLECPTIEDSPKGVQLRDLRKSSF